MHKKWRDYGKRVAIVCLILFIVPWVWSTFGLGNTITQFFNRLNSGVYVVGPSSWLAREVDSGMGGYRYADDDVIYSCRVTLENTTDSPKDVELVAFMPMEFCMAILKNPLMQVKDKNGNPVVFHLEPKESVEFQNVDFSAKYMYKRFPKFDRTLPVIWVKEIVQEEDAS